jgi:hypothetical protein
MTFKMIIVVKSNRVIAKKLESKLKKVSNITLIVNNSAAWVCFGTDQMKQDIVNVLSTYKKQRFEVCAFTDKQLSLTVNKIGFTGLNDYNKKLINLPLKYVFFWYINDNLGRQSCTPLTTTQYNNIVYINRYSDKIAEEMYLDFYNNFLSVDKFASYYNITSKQSFEVINQGKQFHISKF